MTVERPVASIDSRYYVEDKDRHGNVRRYFRRRIPGGTKVRKVRLRQAPGTPEFHEEFAAALAGRPYRKQETRRPEPPLAVAHSLRWLVEEYYRKSTTFRSYDDETKKVRRNILKAVCREPETEGSAKQVGDLPYEIPKDKILVLRDRKAATSIDAANARLKALRQVFNWATSTEPKLISKNIANDIELLPRVDTGGHHTWTIEEILHFVEVHPPGTKAYLALWLFLLTGQRLSDVAKLGKQHIRKPEHISPQLRQTHPGRWLAFRQHKNRNRHPVDLIIPILPQLEEVFGISPCGDLTFLETEHKRPHSTKGLGNWFGDRCVEAGVPGRAHGLRKAGATIAAERGATPHQLKAIFGWKTLEQAEVYTEKVRQQLVAGGAMNLLSFSK
jgi:integrase